jgi:hypothetical protein
MGDSEREEDHGSQWARGRPWEPVSVRRTMLAMGASERSIIIYILSDIHYMYILYIYYMHTCYLFITCTYYTYIYYMYICHHIITMSLLIKQKNYNIR